jgi:hypothetical protein
MNKHGCIKMRLWNTCESEHWEGHIDPSHPYHPWEPSNVELKPLFVTKNPYIDPKLDKQKKNWLHNFNDGI